MIVELNYLLAMETMICLKLEMGKSFNCTEFRRTFDEQANAV